MDKHVHRSGERIDINVFTFDAGFIITYTDVVFTARMVWIERRMDGTTSFKLISIFYNLLLEVKGVCHHFEEDII